MSETKPFQTDLMNTGAFSPNPARKGSLLLRLIRAAQPISRTEIVARLGIDKSTVTENVKPLLKSGFLLEETAEAEGQGRRLRVLSFADSSAYFIGVNLGVRHTQVGVTTLRGELEEEVDFETPSDPWFALRAAKERIEKFVMARPGLSLKVIGVSVPGMTDVKRQDLIFAPNLNWRDVEIAKALRVRDDV